MSLPPAPPPGGDEPTGPYAPGSAPSGPYPAGPYPAGPYPAGSYPAGSFSTMPSAAPPGYAAYGDRPPATTYSGMAIAGFVLALVGILPCFWVWFQVPGLLGVIFSLIGLGATKERMRKGHGLAVAGLVIGIVSLVITVAFTAFIYSTDDCDTSGLTFDCSFDSNN